MIKKFAISIAFVMIFGSSANIFGQQIDVLPNSLSATVGTGDSTVEALTIKNTGTDTLNWSVRIISTSGGAQPSRALHVKTAQTTNRISYSSNSQIIKKTGRGSDGATRFKAAVQSKSSPYLKAAQLSAEQSPPKVAMLIGSCDDATDAINSLVATGMFMNTDFTVINDPSELQLSDLQPYDAVLASTNCQFTYSDMVGNVLKEYVDAGGGVVIATYAYSNSWAMTGGIFDPGYSPFLAGPEQSVSGTIDMNSLTDPNHPIFKNIVTAPTYWYNENYSNPGLNTGGILLAKDTGGNNVVAVNSTGKVVGLVIFPQSLSSGNPETSLLFANALYFVASPAWVNASTTDGGIAPGDSVNISINLNATSLPPGDYDAEIQITSNDTLDTLVTVPVHLTVTPAIIDLAISNLTLDVKAADTLFTSITIGNIGTGYLKWHASVQVPEGDAPSVEPVNATGSVKAGTTQDIQLEIAPGNIGYGTFEYTLEISSNDTANPKKYVTLDITVLPPVITSNPDSFSATIGAGDSTKQTLTIGNTGTGNLAWNIVVTNSPPARIGNFSKNLKQKTGLQARNTVSTNVPGSKVSHVRNSVSSSKTLLRAALAAGPTVEQNILVIQNYDAWGVNTADFILQNFGITATVINSDSIANTDFSLYNLIVTSGDQDDGIYYNALSANVAKFEDYVSNGGVVQYQLATQGDNVDIVGGVSVIYGNQEDWNRVLVPDHPIVAGLDSLLEGNSANHCYLTNLPQEAIIITETQVSHVPTTAEYSYGAGHVIVTGMTWEYLYINQYNSGPMMGKSIEYSLSIGPGNWLSSNPKNGVVVPSGSQDVDIKLDASNLIAGVYDAYLILNSNDPENSQKVIPAHISVLPSVLSLSANELTMNVGAADSGTTTLSIGNTGAGFLKWSALVSGELSPSVRLTPNKGSVANGAQQNVEVKILPVDMPGDYSFNIQLTTNDTAMRKVTIPVTVHILAPSIGTSPDSFEVKIESGDSTSRTLTINNNGSGKLKWNIYVQDVTADESRAPKDIHELLTKNASKANVQSPLKRHQANRHSRNTMLNKAGLFEKLSQAQAAVLPGDFTIKASSPVPLTCVTVDPRTNKMYAQENGGYGFYEYNPTTDQWTDLTSCPLNSGNNGGATYWDGKIYTSYTQLDSIGIYDIAGDSWTTIGNDVSTGNIESVNGYIYLVGDYDFRRYNTSNAMWDTLTAPGTLFSNFDGENTWGGLKYYNGYLYNFNGNGDTAFAKYNLNTQEWTLLPGVPDGAVLGSAIDPVTHKLFAYGDYDGTNWYAFDLITETWSVTDLSLFPAGGGGGDRPAGGEYLAAGEWGYLDDGGMAYISSGPDVGVYFIEGEGGTGLAVFETPRGLTWLQPEVSSGLVSANSSQSVNLKINADTLAIGDYRVLVTVSSNDTGHAVVTIPVNLKVRKDAKGPHISMSFFQDNYLTQYLDVVATMSEPLGSSPLMSVTKPDNSQQALTIDTVDIAGQVYYSHFKLDQSGTFTFAASATDTAGNSSDTSRTLSVTLSKANSLSKLASADAVAELTIGEKSLTEDAYVTVTHESSSVRISENERSVSGSYTFGPENLKIESPMTLSFDYSKIKGFDESHLAIYHQTADGWVILKSSVDRTGKTVLAQVNKLGTYQLFYNASIKSDVENALPTQFSLHQNYPNPFNPTTTIRFDLPTKSKISIAVYNILGQEVRTLANREYEAGVYTVTWDGKNNYGRAAASGIYIYQIKSEKFTQARKMLFVK